MKEFLAILLGAAMLLSLCACGDISQGELVVNSPEAGAQDSTLDEPSQNEPSQDDPGQAQIIEDSSTSTAEIPVTLYYPNDTAEYLLSKEAFVSELSPQALMDLLRDEGILSETVTVNSFTVDNYNSIQLDLSANFGQILNSSGSAGEYIIVGSVVNTFITAFEADSVFLTVDGQTQYGQGMYDSAMSFFE